MGPPIPTPPLFAPLSGLHSQPQTTGRTRRLEGNGTPYLLVPGLKQLESLRVGNLVMPFTRTDEYPVDAGLKRLVPVTLPVISLARADDGTPVILRAHFSNDGIWQAGEAIFVTGDWEPEEA